MLRRRWRHTANGRRSGVIRLAFFAPSKTKVKYLQKQFLKMGTEKKIMTPELAVGLRLGVGRGKFHVQDIAHDGLVKLSCKKRIDSPDSYIFWVPEYFADDLCRIESLEKRYDRINGRWKSQNRVISDLNQELTISKKNLQKMSETNLRLTQDNSKLTEDIANYEGRIESLNRELKQVRESSKNVKTYADNVENELADERDAHLATKQSLKHAKTVAATLAFFILGFALVLAFLR